MKTTLGAEVLEQAGKESKGTFRIGPLKDGFKVLFSRAMWAGNVGFVVGQARTFLSDVWEVCNSPEVRAVLEGAGRGSTTFAGPSSRLPEEVGVEMGRTTSMFVIASFEWRDGGRADDALMAAAAKALRSIGWREGR